MKEKIAWVKKNSVYLLIVMLIIKLFLFRIAVLNDLSLLGVLSDFAAICFLMAAPACLLTGSWRKGLQIIVALLISTIWFSSAVYYSYYGNVPTYYTLANLNQVGQIGESIAATIEPYMLFFFIDFIVIALLLFVVPTTKNELNKYFGAGGTTKVWKARAFPSAVALASLAVMIGSLLGAKQIENSHALAKRLGVLTYQLAISSKLETAQTQELSNEDLNALREEVRQWLAEQSQQERTAFHGVAAGHHLIAVQVEAMQNFVIGLSINGQEVTPYLNKLVDNSFYFPNVYQQIAEGNTSDAEYMFNTGAYPSAIQATSKQLTGKEVASLPRLLSQHGYQSYTFHVNDVTFWNRNEMYPALGFTKYFDRPSFVNDQFNSYGASDEQLYKVALEKFKQLHQQGQRFYAQLVTVSSHHPYKIPQQYQELELPNELEDTQLGHYLQAMHYSDKQLGKFMKELDNSGILAGSVVAIYGDHFGLQPKDNDPDWVSKQLGIAYHDVITRMNVPFIVTVPEVAGERVQQVGGQLDMLPTILNLLGISEANTPLILFGSDLLNSETNVVGVRYYLPTGSFFNDELLFIPGAGFADGKAISLATHEEVDYDVSLKQDYDYILQLMSFSDLYTSNYPGRERKEERR